MIDPKNRYGMMREPEADLIDRMTLVIKEQFGVLRWIEVGVMGAGSVRGLYRRCKEINCPIEATGIDFEMYRPNPTPGDNYKFIGEDSMDAWRKITWTGNFLMVDGCHCVIHAMCDFLNYSPFVEVGGYVVFHDTAIPTALGKDQQEPWPQTDHSYAGKPPSSLGVREGLKKIGLLQGYRSDWKLVEEVTSDSGLMGMCLYQKIKNL